MTRRGPGRAGTAGALAAAALTLLAACTATPDPATSAGPPTSTDPTADRARTGSAGPEEDPVADHPSRLARTARAWDTAPTAPAAADLAPGLHPLGTSQPGREVLAHVPPGLSPESPATLVVALHGAGGDARGGLAPLLPHADAAGLLLLAPSSTGSTWDAIRGRWDDDVALLDRSVVEALERWPVRRDRLVVSGFSDGASYALGVGLANGDLASHVVAFAPGFVPSAPQVGRPAVFVTHGTDDPVLPVDRTSRRIVRVLEQRGHPVEYREFPGGHVVPPELAAEAVRWVTG